MVTRRKGARYMYGAGAQRQRGYLGTRWRVKSRQAWWNRLMLGEEADRAKGGKIFWI